MKKYEVMKDYDVAIYAGRCEESNEADILEFLRGAEEIICLGNEYKKLSWNYRWQLLSLSEPTVVNMEKDKIKPENEEGFKAILEHLKGKTRVKIFTRCTSCKPWGLKREAEILAYTLAKAGTTVEIIGHLGEIRKIATPEGLFVRWGVDNEELTKVANTETTSEEDFYKWHLSF